MTVHARLLTPPPSRGFRIAFAISGSLTILLVCLITYTVTTGIGVWGNRIPVAWAFGIINFVWWIGIGHAGTFISAILYLLEQRWRTPISRFAEAMTLCALVQAAMFPLLHLGRPWFAYWLFPYPSVMGTWPNVKSALPWDAAAITAYLTVSILFFYLGLLPDLASLRDHARSRRARVFYGLFALGWTGSAEGWRHWRAAYLLLAGIATPLVVSVHSVVSSDFATGLTPGWHSTIFPPYFVAGAIFSGFAMVITLIIPVRAAFGVKDLITRDHLERLAKLMLATGLIVQYGYACELFGVWYSGEPADRFDLSSKILWLVILGNVIAPQVLWSRRARRSVPVLLVVSLLVNLGMWAERFVIIVGSLEREYLPAAWRGYSPTWVDLGILLGTFGCFSLLFLTFLRFLPIMPVSELAEEESCAG